MKLQNFFVVLLILIVFIAKTAHSEITAFVQIAYPNGIAVDQQGNVYVQSLFDGLYKLNPEGSLLAWNPNLFGEFRFASDPENNGIWALERSGNLYFIDQETLEVFLAGNVVTVLPPESSTYDILKKENTTLIMVTPSFGDIALYRIGEEQFNLYFTGQTATGGMPFVARIRFESNTFKDASVVGASLPLPTPIIPPPLDTQPSGLAVSSDGKILTTFPENPDLNTLVTKFFLATIGTDFPESNSNPPSFVDVLKTSQVYSLGMTNSPSDKGFFIATVANSFGCQPGIIYVNQTIDSVECVADLSSLGLGDLQPDDVTLTSDNSYLYASIKPNNLVVRIDNPVIPTTNDPNNDPKNNTGPLVIQSPNGSEVWNEKSTQTISWSSSGIDSNNKLRIYISIDNGSSWKKIATVKNVGSKTWKIPKNRYISKQALFRICVRPDETVCDVSDSVFTINTAPKAEAGVKQKVTVGTLVTLDGSSSYDADQGPSVLSYQWTQISGTPVTLNNANTATPSFTASTKGSYKFGLIVNDGAANSKLDKVTVKIVNATQ